MKPLKPRTPNQRLAAEVLAETAVEPAVVDLPYIARSPLLRDLTFARRDVAWRWRR